MPWHIGASDQCPASMPYAVIKDSDGQVEGCHPSKAAAQAQLAALYANEGASADRRDVPERETRVLPLTGLEVRQSNAGDGKFTIRGHAAVFDRLSLDLGGFREKIAKGAFEKVLDASPDVHALWDHDTTKVLARTVGGSLELREDPIGLHVWARVADTSFARDLRVLMEEGLVDQASFGFNVAAGGDEWRIATGQDGQEVVERTIFEVGELYDVTVTAQGAYPQTNTELVRSLRSRMASEIDRGTLPMRAANVLPSGAEPSAATFVSGGTLTHTTVIDPVVVGEETREPALSGAELEARRQRALEDLRNLTGGETALAKEQACEFQRRRYRLSSRDR